MRARLPVLILGAVLGAGAMLAVAGPALNPGGLPTDARPVVAEPLPFDHDVHRKTFRKEGLACVHCHPVGARTEQGAPAQALAAPRSTCHGCHLGTFPGAPRKAASTCTDCHPHRAQLLPADHGLGWLDGHGPAARALRNNCEDCHDEGGCVACHEGRGATSRSPHGAGFRATHGIEARTDPAKCSSCHTEDTCTACHVTGVIPW